MPIDTVLLPWPEKIAEASSVVGWRDWRRMPSGPKTNVKLMARPRSEDRPADPPQVGVQADEQQ